MSKAICRECGAVARTYANNRLSVDVADLYYECSNTDCRHTFVATLAYKHTIRAGQQSAQDVLVAHLAKLDPAEQIRLLESARRQAAALH